MLPDALCAQWWRRPYAQHVGLRMASPLHMDVPGLIAGHPCRTRRSCCRPIVRARIPVWFRKFRNNRRERTNFKLSFNVDDTACGDHRDPRRAPMTWGNIPDGQIIRPDGDSRLSGFASRAFRNFPEQTIAGLVSRVATCGGINPRDAGARSARPDEPGTGQERRP